MRGMAIPTVRLELAAQLRRLRKRYNLSQEQAAERAGLDTLDRLAKGFGVPLWKLFKFKD